jgi:DNA primase
MNQRILCPHHKESTPSCVIYPDGWYTCFGCGARGRAKDIGQEVRKTGTKYVENVSETLAHIATLPKRLVRGHFLHCDEHHYYVVWPDGSYYKRRSFAGDVAGPKYRGPSGVRKPIFWARAEAHPGLIIVEGELNALSVAEAVDWADVVSPGGAGDFASHRLKEDLPNYLKYQTILIVADADKAGAIAVIELASALRPHVSDVRIFLMEEDANDILVNHGKEKLREEFEKRMEVQAQVQDGRRETVPSS